MQRRAGPLLLLLGAVACAGRRPAGEGGAPPAPVVDGAAEVDAAVAPSAELVSREEFRARYWNRSGVELAAELPDPWPVLGTPATLDLVVRNHGLRDVVLPVARRRGLWPFRKTLRAELVLDLVEDSFSLKTGRQLHRWRQVLHPEADWVVPACSAVRFQVPLPPPTVSDAALVRVEVAATLFPLAVRIEGEPESLVALSFPSAQAAWVTAAARPELESADATTLAEGLLETPAVLLVRSVAAGERAPLEVTDWLVRELPGPTRGARAALILGLQAVTGQPFGTAVSRWQSWWASEAGARWAMERRLTRKDDLPLP